LKTHIEPVKLEFLPFHFLLVSVNNYGFMKYLDVSTGKQVSEHRWRWEAVHDLKHNPWNAVVNVADARGVVSIWAPSVGKPLARLVCHNGPVNAIAIDKRGLYLATAGADMKLKVFDVRRLGDPLFEYWLQGPAKTMDISQSGLLVVNQGAEAAVWKDWYSVKQTAPYMRHRAGTAVNDLHFVPYEDFLGAGLVGGFASIAVPGSGFANYDSFEANPFESKRQRQEKEVHSLLEKLQPETIIMNPQEFGTVDKAAPEVIQAEMKAEQEQREREAEETKANKKKKSKKSSTKEKTKKKQSVYDEKTRRRIKDNLRDANKDKTREVEQIAKDLQLLNEEVLGSEEWTVVKRVKLNED
jgi:U3 small nucleolar RNA-associated protein 7